MTLSHLYSMSHLDAKQLKRSIQVTASDSFLMADSASASASASLPSLSDKYKKPVSSFFNCPRLFTSFTSKVLLYETEAVMSPTSILDTKPFSFPAFKNPFWSEASSPTATVTVGEHKRCWDKLDSKGLVDALVDDTKFSQTRMVLFGSQLRFQPPSSSQSPKSPSGSRVKVRDSQLGKSASGSANSALETCNTNTNNSPPRVFSLTEMELSEDYTRVISHGPNPRTTHIFDNCIVEDGSFACPASPVASDSAADQDQITYPSDRFMSFCFYCFKNLGKNDDIYMYRGERAFCSDECRYEGMQLEEGFTKLGAEDVGAVLL